MLSVFSKMRANSHFEARSAARDSDNDYARAASILRSIEHELEEVKAEHAGLTSRIDDVIARAAVTLGNNSDEYLTRDPEDGHCQDLLGIEIANGERRLTELGATVGHFQFLKTALITRFPDLKLGIND